MLDSSRFEPQTGASPNAPLVPPTGMSVKVLVSWLRLDTKHRLELRHTPRWVHSQEGLWRSWYTLGSNRHEPQMETITRAERCEDKKIHKRNERKRKKESKRERERTHPSSLCILHNHYSSQGINLQRTKNTTQHRATTQQKQLQTKRSNTRTYTSTLLPLVLKYCL